MKVRREGFRFVCKKSRYHKADEALEKRIDSDR